MLPISDKMLSKEVDWSILAKCDFYAVEKYVQTPDRLAMRAVEPMQEAMFRKFEEREKMERSVSDNL